MNDTSTNKKKVLQPVPVFWIPEMPLKQRVASATHLIYDGIAQSLLLRFATEEDVTAEEIVWVVEVMAVRELWTNNWCQNLRDMIIEAQEIRKDLGLSTQWKIILIDNRDYPIITPCPHVSNAMGDGNVLYSYRSAVEGRQFLKKMNWVDIGHKLEMQKAAPLAKHAFQQRPIGVRTDIVKSVESSLRAQGLKLCNKIEEHNRTIDVSYFWDFENFERSDAFLRDVVYLTLKEYKGVNTQYNVEIGIKGAHNRVGRKKASGDYVTALLDSKIVVVAQRDKWEDHYRLFEAIVAGCMVMTDRMLSLPAGLQNGTSVVEYTSAEELKAMISYYLTHPAERIEIARRGREIAMSRHRSWHHMEKVLLGEVKTLCRESSSTCPYIVSPNQTAASSC